MFINMLVNVIVWCIPTRKMKLRLTVWLADKTKSVLARQFLKGNVSFNVIVKNADNLAEMECCRRRASNLLKREA